uniref:Uncharacterized protein n=1 Tax=Anopheles maculatus TaxID=74869 RepID=A0A182S5H3_9DIPT
MLLLHLFLKVKMCVGFVDALGTGDSDINYEDSDEWLRDVGGGRLPTDWVTVRPVSTTTGSSIPAPSNLMRWEEPTGGRYRMHHVRHEQHYLKHRPIKVVPNVGESTMVALDPQAHTVEQKSRHHNNHHTSHHHHHHHHHHSSHVHHVQQYPNTHGRKSGATDASEEEVSLVEATRQDAAQRLASHPFERRAPFEKRRFNDVWDSLR